MRFTRVPWSLEAETAIDKAMKYADDMRVVRQQVEQGIAELWQCDDGVSWLVTRAEFPELVIVAYQGQHMKAMFRRFYQFACEKGFHSLRWHTQQPWINDVLSPWEPEPIEYVMRVYTDGWKKQKLYRSEHVDHDDERTGHRHYDHWAGRR